MLNIICVLKFCLIYANYSTIRIDFYNVNFNVFFVIITIVEIACEFYYETVDIA